MHEECIILRFEIVVFCVMGPCNVNGQQRRSGLDLLSGVPRNFVRVSGGSRNSVEDRDNRDLGAVAP
jgi:hypothetical protein